MSYFVPLPPNEETPNHRILFWTLRLLATIALSCSLFLSWRSIQSGPIPGCSGTAWDCDHVVTSTWSRWLGIPVSYLGSATYFCLLVGLSALKPVANETQWKRQRLILTFLLSLSVTAALSGLWFTYVQTFELGKFCPYCMAAHVCGFAILSLISWHALRFIRHPHSAVTLDGNAKWLVAVLSLGASAAATIVLGQYFFPHDTMVVERHDVEPTPTDVDIDGQDMFESPVVSPESVGDEEFLASPAQESRPEPRLEASPDQVSSLADDLADIGPAAIVVQKPILSGRQNFFFYAQADPINVHEYPVLGSPDAEHLMVEVVDYTCHHCREMYHHVEAARAYFGDRLAVIVRPVALDQHCNPYVIRQLPEHENACKYVRLALAVWSRAPESFPEFHHWLMGPKNVPALSTASSFAAELIGAEPLKAAVRDTDVLGMLGKNHLLWNRIGGTLPLIFAGRSLIRGMPRDDAHFIDALSKQFNTGQ